ncbi:phosphatase PAP2 family protein [Spiroplasma endosymbiont of Diplazon laetatorius]|uniref:phosphatase PAP2 family protein n=1 Tax=Spiroplasma endosymbiont of Diplazon laetatorius TaxID=3066322 RepID=UPI0030D034EF
MFVNKKKTIFSIFTLTLFSIVFLISSFYDLKIAKSIDTSLKDNLFFNFLDGFAVFLFLIPLFWVGLIYLSKWLIIKNTLIKSITFIGFYVIFIVFSFLLLYFISKNKEGVSFLGYQFATFIFLTLILLVITIICTKNILLQRSEEIDNLVKMANTTLIFMIMIWLICTGMKYIFGRNRPENVLGLNANFQFPFQINFKRTSNSTSFPSGHTTSACQLLFLGYFCNIKKTNKGLILKSTILTLVGILVITMGISRLALQRHFLTDILLSMFISGLSYYFAPIILEKLSRRIKKNG